jgi:tetratricopeptide (TPR) repeat protein
MVAQTPAPHAYRNARRPVARAGAFGKRPWLGAVLLGGLISIGSADLWAQEPASSEQGDSDARQRAEQLYYNGEALYEEGQYEAAILAFEEAYRLSEEPLLLYNIANAYERLGELDHAIDYLTRYRAFAPPEERESLRRRVRNLERRMEAAETPPSSGDAGSDLAGGADAGAGQPDDTGDDEAAFGAAEWALTGVAAGSLATGVAFSFIARERRQAVEDQCVTVSSSTICPTSAQDDHDAWRRSAIAADVGYGLAVASTIALVVLLATSSDEAPDEAGDLSVSVGPTGPYAGGVLGLRGRF